MMKIFRNLLIAGLLIGSLTGCNHSSSIREIQKIIRKEQELSTKDYKKISIYYREIDDKELENRTAEEIFDTYAEIADALFKGRDNYGGLFDQALDAYEKAWIQDVSNEKRMALWLKIADVARYVPTKKFDTLDPSRGYNTSRLQPGFTKNLFGITTCRKKIERAIILCQADTAYRDAKALYEAAQQEADRMGGDSDVSDNLRPSIQKCQQACAAGIALCDQMLPPTVEAQDEERNESLNDIRFKDWSDEDWLNNDYIAYLRRFLTDVSKGKTTLPDEWLSDFSDKPLSLLGGKFIVKQVEPCLYGGLAITFKILDDLQCDYYAWVYSDVDTNEYEIRGLDIIDMDEMNDEDIKTEKQNILKFAKEHPNEKILW